MIRPVLTALLLLAACAPASAQVRGDIAILPGSAASELLEQCSRTTPKPGEGTWAPSWSDIAALEAALPAALTERTEARALADRTPPEGWVRQYVGLIRDGRRFVYGNFVPQGSGPDPAPDQILMVCDGGPAFFGVEFEVEAGRITHLAFNGEA